MESNPLGAGALKRRLSWSVVILGLSGVAFPAGAQVCEKENRDLDAGTARVTGFRAYTCKRNGIPLVRITFSRLAEGVAGSLVMGEPIREFTNLYGEPEILQNDVYSELHNIFAQFGDKKVIPRGEFSQYGFLTIATPGGGSSKNISGSTESGTIIWWQLTPPNPAYSSDGIYLSYEDEIINNTDRWPPGFNFFYSAPTEESVQACLSDFSVCTTVWRYVKPDDLNSIEEDTREYRLKAEAKLSAEEKQALQEYKSNAETNYASTDYARHFALFRYLSLKGWPDDFLVIKDGYYACGEEAGNWRYFPRPLILDVAMIENLHLEPLRIDDLLGSRSGTDKIRDKATSDNLKMATALSLGTGSIVLQPGAKVLLMERILFADGTGLKTGAKLGEGDPWGWTTLDAAQKAYERFQAAEPVTIEPGGDRVEITPETSVVRKTRSSFQPPTLPSVTEYVYGPEVLLKGFVIDGEQMLFESTSANFMEFTTASPEASCPILYAWDQQQGVWVQYGKVIHAAREANREATETIAVEPSMTRFRISEEEPEVSYINAVSLQIELNDGHRFLLRPLEAALQQTDRSYFRILAGDKVDITFELPDGINRDLIKKSELIITGYYRPYSSIIANKTRP